MNANYALCNIDYTISKPDLFQNVIVIAHMLIILWESSDDCRSNRVSI